MGKGKKDDRRPHRHELYAAAVQSVDADLDFANRVYRKVNGTAPRTVREDFCGTSLLACTWAGRDANNAAWGIDIDEKTLAWGRCHYVAQLGEAARRVHLLHGDVLETETPAVDVALALNFSYCVFKQRELLRRYFERIHAVLSPGGMLFLDVFGGSEAFGPLKEKTPVRGCRDHAGRVIPRFTFIWEHERFNPVTNEILCHIHFKLQDGTRLKRAFTYDWRIWTLPELREVLGEAGFAAANVYTHGWDDDGTSDGTYRKKRCFDNEEGWLAYVVGVR